MRCFKRTFFVNIFAFASCLFLTAQVPLSLQAIVERCVQHNVQIEIAAKQVDVSRAVLQQVRGSTDLKVGSEVQHGVQLKPYAADDPNSGGSLQGATAGTSLSTYLQKQFRSGLSLQPELTYSLSSPTTQTLGGDVAYPTTTYASAMLNLSLPLLKSFGASPVRLNHRAYYHLLLRQQYLFTGIVAEQLRDTLKAYWAYSAAYHRWMMQQDLEKSLHTMAADVQRLVEAGKFSESDVALVEAELSANRVQTLSAQQDFQSARIQVARLIALPLEKLELLSAPEGSLSPELLNHVQDNAIRLDRQHYIDIGQTQRPEILAQREYLRYSQLISDRARVMGRPDLDLKLYTGFTGTNYGEGWSSAVTSLASNIRGLDYGGTLSFSMSLPDNSSAGVETEKRAKAAAERLRLEGVEAQVSAEIVEAVEKVRLRAEMLLSIEKARSLYLQILEGESRRMQAGLASVRDLIDTREEYLNVELSYSQSLASYLQAIVDLRHSSGQLVSLTDTEENIVGELLSSLPDDNRKGRKQ